MKMIQYGLVVLLSAVLVSPVRALEPGKASMFDVCVDPTTGFVLDDVDGNQTLSTGDGFTGSGIIVVGGTIPQGGVASCSDVAGARIGTFFAQGRVVAGLPTAAPDDVAYVDWEFRIDTLGSIDTTGLVKAAATYPQTITGATGLLGAARGQALTQVLDESGFQFRLIVPSVTEPLEGVFAATLTGSQEVPPVDTRASGKATLKLNADRSLSYHVGTSGPITAFAAHIHDAPAGTNGPIIFPLNGGPRVWEGTTPPLTPDQQAKLLNGEYYINAHTDEHPTGIIRGQIGFVGD
jgi:hypothetical protein